MAHDTLPHSAGKSRRSTGNRCFSCELGLVQYLGHGGLKVCDRRSRLSRLNLVWGERKGAEHKLDYFIVFACVCRLLDVTASLLHGAVKMGMPASIGYCGKEPA